MGINQDGQDYSYFSSIRVGSKGKDMWMLIDSGSANTWVFAADCTSQACRKHDTFGKADSDTLDMTSNRWSVTYGTGNVGGVVASDKIAFAGYEVQLGFGLATNASDDFSTYPMDGILGLGRASSNKLGTPTLMDVMASQKLLKANLFGVHLSRSADGATDGQITFGEADSSRFSGDLSYTDSLTLDGLWEIPCDGAAVDGQSLGLTGKTAIIDTGTSYVLMPPKDAKALHAKIPGSSNNGEAFTVPCETKLPIQFTFSGVSYDVLPKDYVGKPDKTGKICASNIVGHQSFGVDTWLLGDVFLKNVYTVFDFDKDRIGMHLNLHALLSLLLTFPQASAPSLALRALSIPHYQVYLPLPFPLSLNQPHQMSPFPTPIHNPMKKRLLQAETYPRSQALLLLLLWLHQRERSRSCRQHQQHKPPPWVRPKRDRVARWKVWQLHGLHHLSWPSPSPCSSPFRTPDQSTKRKNRWSRSCVESCLAVSCRVLPYLALSTVPDLARVQHR
jgi:Eukaryotic aspartyl protease